MSNKVFDELLKEKIEVFLQAFQSTSRSVFIDINSKIRHPGEFGTYREKITKDFLRFFVPQKLDIGNGFIISPNDEISTQCDIIIFDSTITPLIQSNELQTFYPVETVVRVGEVKSVMSKLDLKNAINKLAKTKQIKFNISGSLIQCDFIQNDGNKKREFNPKIVPFDSIITFIICESFSFKLEEIENDFNDIYNQDISYHCRHNLILSLKDGLFLYNLHQEKESIPWIYPFKPINQFSSDMCTHRFEKNKENNEYRHIKTFVMSVFNGISQATILFPDMVNYMSGFSAVNKIK